MMIILCGVIFLSLRHLNALKLIVLKEGDWIGWEETATDSWQSVTVTLDRDRPEESFQKVCSELEKGAWGVLDLSRSGWEEVARLPGLRYLRADLGVSQFIRAAEASVLEIRKSSDAALIFQHSEQVEQCLWYLVRESSLRVTVLEGLNDESAEKLREMRPSPNSYVIFADTENINQILTKALEEGLGKIHDRWALVFLDMNHHKLNRTLLTKKTMLLTISPRQCCRPAELLPCLCPQDFTIEKEGVKELKTVLEQTLELSLAGGLSGDDTPYYCQSSKTNDSVDDTAFYNAFSEGMKTSWLLRRGEDEREAELRLELDVQVEGDGASVELARWEAAAGLKVQAQLPDVKRFFRIGTGFSMPFAYETGRTDEEGRPEVEGYAIDLIQRLSEMMNFDYELVLEEDFGTKEKNGSWRGLVGLLATGRIDMIIGSLTMTSEREEVIDFVAPYFEQTGFSIIIRKPVKKTSLFKFMTVLRVEVWLSILGALCLTAIMIWLLDKYSPYSARNNKEKYPYPCRDFSLRESFWFAVTSFTPQGGGEAPKSLSARTLVAAYWLFVVLMLATFTANLAAFLTVERMQSPVQSLKHLARQSRINYTVVKDSDAHIYFRNMKNAEEILYRKWKEITLNSSSDQSQYRVWDYPIKEQYGHILMAIEKAGPVVDLEEGLRKVEESGQAEFALIHDHLELKYHVYNNCNLTHIGEPFAEQPYAIAVQQGSHLNEEISRRILDLQRERFFETSSAKYWKSRTKAKCDSVDEDEGITLESLGGVFIATLVGLFLAMITLGIEVWYHKKKTMAKIGGKTVIKQDPFIRDEILTAKEFGHLNLMNNKSTLLRTRPKPKVNEIHVLPKVRH